MSILARLRAEQIRVEKPTKPTKPTKAEKVAPKKRKPQGSYKHGPGRSPSASPAYARNKRISIALSLPEYEALHTAAAGRGIPASTFLRKALFGEVSTVRPHPANPKSEAAAALLSGTPVKLDGRTRAGKAAKKRKQKTTPEAEAPRVATNHTHRRSHTAADSNSNP